MPNDTPLGRRPVHALIAVLVVAVVTALAWYVESPPAPRPADATPAEFAAGRVGQPPGDLVAAFAGLGIPAQVQRAAGLAGTGQAVTAGTVENVVATLPGSASTGRIVVTAPAGASAAATILEVARALKAGPRPRNDVEFVLTGGADGGPVGVAAALGTARPVVVLDVAGPGTAPPSAVVATSTGAGPLTAALTGVVGSSVGPATAALLPGRDQRPDLGVVDVADRPGVAGLVLGSGIPDSAPALQQHGDTVLALTRSLGDRDVAGLVQRSSSTFVTVFGLVLAWSDGWLVALAFASVVLLFALASVAVRRRVASGWRLAGGALWALVALAVGALLGGGFTQLLTAVRPGFLAAEPSGSGYLGAAVGALAAVVVLVWTGLLRGRSDGFAPAFGGLVWLTVLGVVLAGLAPGAAVVATVPALVMTVAVLVAVLIGPSRPVWQLAAWTVGAIPAALVLLGAGRDTVRSGFEQASVAAVAFVAFGLVVLPIVVAAVGRRRRLVPVLAVLASVGLVAAGLQLARFDAAHPQPTVLSYVADASAGTARWVSTDPKPPDWTRRYAGQTAAAIPPLPYGSTPLWSGTTSPVALAAPELMVLGTRPAPDGSVVSVRLRSARAAPRLVLDVDRPVTRVTVDGVASPALGTAVPSGTSAWPFRVQVVDPPAGGTTVELTVADATGLLFSVADATSGLGAVPGYTPPPAGLVVDSRPDSGLVVVSRLAP